MIRQLFIGIGTKLKGAVARFPETLLLCAFSGAVMIYLMHMSYVDTMQQREMLNRVLMSLAIGIFTMGTFTLIIERWLNQAVYRLAASGLVVAIMVLFYFLIPDPMTNLFGWRYGVTIVSLLAAFSLVPFWKKESYYPVGALKLISDGAITFLYSLVLYLGGAAILFTLEELLGVPVDSDWYGDYAVLIGSLFAPTHYLGNLIKDGESIGDYSFSNVFKILLANIVIPLLLIYTAILYLYFLRLPFVGGLPQGEMANLVMWYSAITLATFFLVSPLRSENRLVELFLKWMPVAMIVPVTMMFVAIGVRIDAYGITVKRYFVVALGIWIAANVLYRIVTTWRKKEVLDSALVLTAVVVMLLSLYGPWSAYPVSIWNQNQRFESTLEALNLWDGEQFTPRSDLSQEDRSKVNQILSYFSSQHALTDIKILPEKFNLNKDMLQTLGFEYDFYYDDRASRVYYNVDSKLQNFKLETKKAARIYRINWYQGESNNESAKRKSQGLTVEKTGIITLIDEAGGNLTIDFASLLEAHLKANDLLIESYAYLDGEKAKISYSSGGRDYTFFIESVSSYRDGSGPALFDRLQLFLIAE